MYIVPKGIQQLERKNQDGSVVISFRVQIKRKDLSVDERFSSLDEAIKFLSECRQKLKLPELKLVRRPRTSEELEQMKQSIHNFWNNPTFKTYVNKYLEVYITPRFQHYEKDLSAEGKMKYRNYKNIVCFYNTINNTLVKNDDFKGVLDFQSNNPFNNAKTPLGLLPLLEIDEDIINSYVYTRAKLGKKSQSIQREITFISNIFSKARHLNPTIKSVVNPTLTYDRDFLKLAKTTKKNPFRFTGNVKEEFLKAVEEHENPEFHAIVKIMLLTAMRRSEAVLLKWSQIYEDFIELEDTKTNPRPVYLTVEAKELLKSIPRKSNQDRLFKYTVLGFDGSYKKFMTDRGFGHITTHKLRKEAISNFVEKIGAENSLLIAEILGISSIRKLEENIAEMPRFMKTQKDVLQSVGHKNSTVTKKHYFSLKK